MISDNVQTGKVGRSNTVAAGGSPRPRQRRFDQGHSDPEDNRLSKAAASRPRDRDTRDPKDLRRQAARPPHAARGASGQHRPSLLHIDAEARLSSSSLPDFRNNSRSSTPLPTPPATAGLGPQVDRSSRKHSGHHQPPRPLTPTALSRAQKVRLLRSNYFRNETQFLSALEDISSRLVSVPKPARLSALRAELALIAQDLPAEVDIPLLSPPTLKDGIPSQSQHHRIVRINPAEATSLNSAEKVPYLLMVEVLKEDFDFDPDSEQNQQLLEKLMLEKGTSRRRLFDITNAERLALDRAQTNGSDSVFEPATGDLGSTALIKRISRLTPPPRRGRQRRRSARLRTRTTLLPVWHGSLYHQLPAMEMLRRPGRPAERTPCPLWPHCPHRGRRIWRSAARVVLRHSGKQHYL